MTHEGGREEETSRRALASSEAKLLCHADVSMTALFVVIPQPGRQRHGLFSSVMWPMREPAGT